MATVFTHPLLATEHTEFDLGAERLAFALARRCGLPLAAVLPLVSNAEFEAVAPELAARADAVAAMRREQVEVLAAGQGVALELRVRHGQEPFVEIVDEARERGADLLVIRRRGKRGLFANLLIGEMVSKVVAHAPCSVLIVPRAAAMWSRQVLVGTDPQAPAPEMLARAADIAAECAIGLRVLCAAANDGARAQAEQALAAALLQARARCPLADGEVRIGRPHQALMEAAAACGADLIVIGRHGGDALSRVWIGGTAQKVTGLAECPVLIHVKGSNARTESA
jgi:nucleotide-binding universal stress UspA family protein